MVRDDPCGFATDWMKSTQIQFPFIQKSRCIKTHSDGLFGYQLCRLGTDLGGRIATSCLLHR